VKPGQELGLAQLRRLAGLSRGAIRLGQPVEVDATVRVPVNLATGHLPSSEDGLSLRDREGFLIGIGPQFPHRHPDVYVAHHRWDGRPHVQRGGVLCLYLAPSSEWNPADGMHGFVERLMLWLTKAAVAELDPAGVPPHPPVAYPEPNRPTVVVRADTPAPSPRLVFATARRVSLRRIEIDSWEDHPVAGSELPTVAAFTPDRLATFEFPQDVGGLAAAFDGLGLDFRHVLTRIVEGATAGAAGCSVLVLFAGGSRTASDGEVSDHFMAWEVPVEAVNDLRTVRLGSDPQAEQAALQRLTGWLSQPASYRHVEDARPQVARRRDDDTPAAAFAGLAVEVWGAGALGGWMAELLLRAGVRSLTIKDHGVVRPGLLVRQPYDDSDVTEAKAVRLAARLQRIFPGRPVVGIPVNVLDDMDHQGLPDADILIDATADRGVSSRLEFAVVTAEPTGRRPVIAATATDARAELLFLAVCGTQYSGGPTDVARKTGIELLGRPAARPFLEAFWEEEGHKSLFRPEPGCSDVTFRGSAADAMSLAGAAVTQIGEELPFLGQGGGAVVRLSRIAPTTPRAVRDAAPNLRLTFTADAVINFDSAGYHLRLSPEAERTIRDTAVASIVADGRPQPETGGLLFGERDDAAGVVWISAASPPPADSSASNLEFVCGTQGTKLLNDQYRRASGDAVAYVGMWHTHPGGRPSPSDRDRRTMASQAAEAPGRTYLIAGGDLTAPTIGAYLGPFEFPASTPQVDNLDQVAKEQPARPGTSSIKVRSLGPPPFRRRRSSTRPRWQEDALASPAAGIGGDLPRPCEAPMPADRHPWDPLPAGVRPIGVAMSGGGFRATLAALGVLRYLADARLLFRVRLTSSVSGGSVLNGVFAIAYDELRRSNFDPDCFDELVTVPIVAHVTSSSFTAMLTRHAWRALVPGRTRTHVLERCLDRRFFDHTLLSELPTGCWFEFNAANVATGARFRFNRDVAGDYVVGSAAVAGTDLRVATAVAASAAVPGPFPPLVITGLPFACGDHHQVRLVDGGAYDNLGLEPLSKRPELFLVALNAGGLFHTDNAASRLRIPVVSNLLRANALLYRQVSSLRSRGVIEGLMGSSPLDAVDRSGIFVTLSTRFDRLDNDELRRVNEWRSAAEEQSEAERKVLAATSTSFGRFDESLVSGLVYRGWWLTGAAMAVYHRTVIPESLPRWRDIRR